MSKKEIYLFFRTEELYNRRPKGKSILSKNSIKWAKKKFILSKHEFDIRMTRILRCLSFHFVHSTRRAVCRFCIFMQGWKDWKTFCKVLYFNTLRRVFQKLNFCVLKVQLSSPKSSTAYLYALFRMFMQCILGGTEYYR